MSADEAAAVAVRLNPKLRAARARIGVAEAELVEAGLLPDIQLGWGASDVFADAVFDGTIADTSYLSGLSIGWEVPRPGEIDAREQIAAAGIEGARAEVLARELEVVRDAHVAHVRVLAVDAQLELNRTVAAVADRTRDYFERARAQGAATALQASVTHIALAQVELEAIRLQNQRWQAAQALNAVLGLPPLTELRLQGSLVSSKDADLPSTPVLLDQALSRRPDLRALQAAYARAEAEVRLEVTRQWPRIQIGTGFQIDLAIFRSWNSPAIDTALRRRDALFRDLEGGVYEIRREVHAARALFERTLAELRFLEEKFAPRLDESLRLASAAFEAQEVTLFEVLTAQTQVTEARERLLDARARHSEARVHLDAATGALLPTSEPRGAAAPESKESK